VWSAIRRSLATASAVGAGMALLVPAASAAGARARAEGAFDSGDPRVEARLLVHPDDRGGRVQRVGVLFQLDPGWHLYWRNPGETGIATVLDFELEGGRVGPIAWPAPRAFGEAGDLFTAYGYEDRVLLTAEAELDGADLRGRRLRARADLLVCETECIPATLLLERQLPGAASDPDADARDRELFREAAASLPVPPAAWGATLEATSSPRTLRPGEPFEAAIRVHPCAAPGSPADCALEPAAGSTVFFPELLPGVDELEVAGVEPEASTRPSDGGGFRIQLRGRAASASGPGPARLRGVLALRTPDGSSRALEVDLPFLAASAAARPGAARSFAALLGLAFLGGLLLNLMPCVLPVLAIKVCSLAELAQRSRREVLLHGAAYAGGILSSLSALAGAVVALRHAGRAVGWGFQFQEPVFLAAVSTVLLVFALNLFGVFEIRFHGGGLANLGHEATGARRSFFEGLLAVVLATPCSAPFLGTAVGFAFAASAPAIFAIFGAIGLGLAAPFVAVSLVPAWRWIVPRAGVWMLKLRAGLGFALLASVVWLLWIAGRSFGGDGVSALLAFLLAVAFATWVFGQVQATDRAALARVAAAGLAALVVGGHVALVDAISLSQGAEASGPAAELAFAPERVQEALREGRPAFVYFTADWCLTCKVNERLVLEDERVRSELQRLGFAVFAADWTQRDDAIRAELARFGKAGVPLYLVYRPDAPDAPDVLPELLSVERLLTALRDAAPPAVARM
jgi:thiol:disulfide interchange protein/DsbC/DsbD-like thiol-disulfide interchange protein